MAGRPTRITRYAYDAHGTRTQMIASDGTTTDYRYDRRSRLRELVQRSAAAAILFSATYTTDAAGLRTGITEADATGLARTVAYAYDATRRLTQETIAHRDATRDRTTAWTYDRVGNRLTQVTTTGSGATQSTTTVTSDYDANDRLTREEERRGTEAPRITTTTYDANGNTTRKESPDGVTDYAWDDANRLKEQRTASGRAEYRYDADGLRIGQTTYPTTGTPTRTDYLVDPTYAYANVIERWEGEGAASPKLAAVHVFGEGIVGQTTCTPTATSAATDCPDATERVLHADGFGSTRYLTNAAGAITDRIDYDAFGTEIHREGDTDVEHLYRGEQYDANLGWYYLRARYMDPSAGRFLSVDPFDGRTCVPLSLHDYLYAHDDPVNLADPSGMSPLIGQMNAIGMQAMSAIRSGVASVNTIRRFNAKLCSIGKTLAMPYSQLKQRLGPGSIFQAHHVFQDARAAQSVLNYKRLTALAVPLLGGNDLRGGAHRATWLLQVKEPLPNPATIQQMKEQAFRALRAAGCRRADATEIVDFAADAIELMRLGVL